MKENKGWQYKLGKQWSNKELIEYERVKDSLQETFDDYLLRKRMDVIPFTEELAVEEFNNEEIYKDLKEIEGYLQKSAKKTSKRLY